MSSAPLRAAYFAHFGLSIPEWRVMAVLAANPGLSAAEVTARTAMDKVAVSRAVATLLAAGRLRRTTAPADRRRTHLATHAAPARAFTRRSCPMALELRTRPGRAAVSHATAPRSTGSCACC